MHFQPVEHTDEDGYLAAGSPPQVANTAPDDPLDDVFGSSEEFPAAHPALSHPSDMHRLETEHATTGYREGVAVAKASSVQAGFDEGFSLGATIGLLAGQLLGTLEAIAEAVAGREDDASTTAERVCTEAKVDLSTDKIFGPEYWAPDGNWSYDVKAENGDDVVFPDVARAHPLIRKWTDVVDEQMKLWKIDRSILDDETGPRLETLHDEPIASSATPAAKKPLDW